MKESVVGGALDREEREAVARRRYNRLSTLLGSAGLLAGILVAAALVFLCADFLFPLRHRRDGGTFQWLLLGAIVALPPIAGARWGVNCAGKSLRNR